jgi:hypothetical protein
MAADLAATASLVITAKDQTAEAFAGVKRGIGDLKGALTGIHAQIVALGGALGVGLFARAIKDAIDYADQLDDLAQKTGISVEALGGLGYAAKQEGIGLEGLAKGAQKLSVLMAEAAAGTDRAQGVFASMGIAVSKSDGSLAELDDTLIAVADRFASYADGPAKAALAQELFGKTGADLIPFLNLGGEKLREMVEEYKKYGGVSTETAQRAGAFNDTLEKIRLMSGAFMRTLAAELLPVLQVFANLLVELKSKGGDFSGSVSVIVNVVKGLGIIVVGVVTAFQALGRVIGAVAAAMVQFAEGNYSRAWETMKAGAIDAVDTVKKGIDDAAKIWNSSTASMAASSAKNVPAAIAPVVVGVKQVKDAVIDYAMAIAQLELEIKRQMAAASGLTIETTNYDKALLQVEKDLIEGKRVTNEQIDAYLAAARALDVATKAAKEYAVAQKILVEEAAAERAAWAAADELLRKRSDAMQQAIEQQDFANDALAREIAIIGQGLPAHIELNRQLEIERITRMAIDPEQKARLIALANETAQLQLLKVNTEAQVGAWQALMSALTASVRGFISDVVEGGWSNAFKNLWANFKRWALEALAQIAAKQVVVGITGAVATGGAAAGGLGGGGGLDVLGLVKNGASFLAGGLETAAFAAADFAQLVGQGVGVFEAFGTAAGAAGIGLAQIVPVVGAIAAAGYMIYNFVKSKEGGPKSGGFAASGATPGISGTDDSGARWFTPSQSDADLVKAVTTIQSQYNALLQAFGGSGNATFAVGFDTDPQGKAPNRVHTGVFANGAQVYNAAYGDLGRDPEQLNATLALEAKRQLLAALQASDLPQYLASILDDIDAATADSGAIDAVLQTAAAMKQVVDVIGALGGAMSDLEPEQILDLVDAFGSLNDVVSSMAFIRENFTTDAEKLTSAQQQLTDAFGAMGLAVPGTHQAFMDLLNGLDLTTEEGRTTYATIAKLGPLFVQVFGTAEEAASRMAEEEKRLADARKQAIASAEEFFNSNFFSQEELTAQRIADAWRVVNDTWTQSGDILSSLGIDHIPTTNAAFRELIQGLDRTTPAGRALYDILIQLAPTIFGLNQDIASMTGSLEETTTAVDKVSSALENLAYQASQTAAQTAASQFQTIWAAIQEISNGMGGDFGARLATTLRLIPEQIARVQAELDAEIARGGMYSPLAQQLRQILAQLGAANQQAVAQLARYTVLSAQYGAAKAEELVKLEAWYEQMKTALAGQAEALAALGQLFAERWQEIIDGAGGSAEELARLRQSIRDFLDSLKQSELSPLSPQQKFLEAQKDYLALLAKAQAGDTEALSKLPAAAQEYLQLAQMMYASSGQYASIYQSVVAALEALTQESGPGVPGGSPTPTAAIAEAMPTGSPISSRDDIDALRAEVTMLRAQIASLTSALVAGNDQVSSAVHDASATSTRTLAAAMDVRR